MGASAKTLSRLTALYDQGYLKPGAAIVELGTQEVYCAGQESYVAEVIEHFAKENPAAKRASQCGPLEISRISNQGLMGELMTAKSYSQVVELSSAYLRKQFDALTSQTKELYEHAQKVATETAGPIKESISSTFSKAA